MPQLSGNEPILGLNILGVDNVLESALINNIYLFSFFNGEIEFCIRVVDGAWFLF